MLVSAFCEFRTVIKAAAINEVAMVNAKIVMVILTSLSFKMGSGLQTVSAFCGLKVEFISYLPSAFTHTSIQLR